MHSSDTDSLHTLLDSIAESLFSASAIPSALRVLEVNGWILTASEESVVEHTLGLAVRKVCEETYAEWLRENSQRAA